MTGQEKRKHRRILSLNLSYICLDKDGRAVRESMGRTLNVSLSGICLETHFPVDESMQLKLTIALENELVDVNGRVIYCRGKEGELYDIGIEFSAMDEKAKNVVDEFVAYFLESRKENPPALGQR